MLFDKKLVPLCTCLALSLCISVREIYSIKSLLLLIFIKCLIQFPSSRYSLSNEKCCEEVQGGPSIYPYNFSLNLSLFFPITLLSPLPTSLLVYLFHCCDILFFLLLHLFISFSRLILFLFLKYS